VVFDQTEVSGIYTCEMGGQLPGGAGLWLVNGDDITPGNLGGFTNQITVDHNCQFDEASAYAVIDDGGDCHYFGHNNVNGGGLRFCGVANLTLMGGEFESVNGRPTITFTYLKHYQSAVGVGACSAVICNGLISQPAGQPCINIVSLYNLNMTRTTLTATGVTGCVTGTENVGTLFARQNANPNTAAPVFNTYSGSSFDDGYIRTTSTAYTGFAVGLGHINSHVVCTSASPVAVTIPSNATLAFPIGTFVMIEQSGSGTVTVSPASGVTLNGTLATAGQFQLLTLRKTAPDRWLATREG
jgi:3D (Asp-Asp-Asp) domain-containing protein